MLVSSSRDDRQELSRCGIMVEATCSYHTSALPLASAHCIRTSYNSSCLLSSRTTSHTKKWQLDFAEMEPGLAKRFHVAYPLGEDDNTGLLVAANQQLQDFRIVVSTLRSWRGVHISACASGRICFLCARVIQANF